MAVDPRLLVEEFRPHPSPEAEPFTPQPNAMRRLRETTLTDHQGRERSVDELNGSDPRVYMRKVPPPPCAKCNQDHQPGHTYDHEYLHPDQVHTGGVVMLVTNDPPPDIPAPQAIQQTPTASDSKRVSVFPGREDSFVLVVEERDADDWSDVQQYKLDPRQTAVVVPILRALGVKLKDRTGGDLTTALQDYPPNAR